MALSQLEVTGAEVYATTLGDELTARGHQVWYVSDTLTRRVKGAFIPLAFNKRSIPRRLWHVARLVWLIRKNKIQLVHAHSRASGWSARVACWLTKTPMVTTVHGRQPTHGSRKWFRAFGARAIAVCEAVRDQLVDVLGLPADQVVVIRNGIDPTAFPVNEPRQKRQAEKPRVAIVGRLTGPKGELCRRLLSDVLDLSAVDVRVVTGSKVPPAFQNFSGRVTFVRDQSVVAHEIAEADLVIGAGRVAVEALFTGTPVFAVGETRHIGLVGLENLEAAMASNFGDVGDEDLAMDFEEIKREFASILIGPNALPPVSTELRNRALEPYSLKAVASQVEEIYQDAVVGTLRREMPILMYHRLVEHPSEQGVHGTWTTVQMFEKHLRLIQRMGFETLTFRDLHDRGFMHRFSPGRRYLMITADDGYQDNLTRMLPLLKKYNMKATVYVVSGETHNRWDVEHPTNPDVRVPLLSADEIRALDTSGHVEIGGHTLSHAKLDDLNAEAQAREIRENKRALEDILGHPMLSFAYPFGFLNESAKTQAREAGYAYAVATDSGPKAIHRDPFEIRRIAVFPGTNPFGLWRKIRGDYVFRK
jgi:peptidoglycan/xylan/chitin deacetylase (PgdA/CDA1 family)